MKKFFLRVLIITGLFFTGLTGSAVHAFEAMSTAGLIGPAVDMDLVVIHNSQSKTVTVDLNFPMDFAVTPVLVIGKGPLRVNMSKTNTSGELVYLYIRGLDDPKTDFNYGITPLSLSVSSTNGMFDYNLAWIISGILYSTEEAPYEYNLSLSY